jgi:hypothetical protein
MNKRYLKARGPIIKPFYLQNIILVILPAMISKINPENSDFSVGNFLTAHKKTTSCQEVAFPVNLFFASL